MVRTVSRPDAPPARGASGGAAAATLAYLALALAATWPLARGLARDVPGDFGDPLLNAWILTWDARHLLAAAGGHLGALREYWQATVFYPHPYVLAYSEHLTAQAIEILPIYAITGNPLLCYNLLFLSTFVLSGLGAFLFVRETTGSRAAGFIAGLAYAIAPYRFSSIAHVQVLSSQWMPFTLFALHRYFDRRQPRALIGFVAAFAAQALSCGYFLLFFAPVVAIVVAWELGRTGRWSDRRTWLHLLAAAAALAAIVVPFLIPYVEVRRLGLIERSLAETDHFAADVYAYFTADVQLRVWGRLARAWPRPEGSLFPGGTIAILAIWAGWRAWIGARVAARPTATINVVRALLMATLLVGVAILLRGNLRVALGPVVLKASGFDRLLLVAAVLTGSLLALRARGEPASADGWVRPYGLQAGRWLATPAAIMTIVLVFAVAMSFGPHIHSRGRLVTDENVYLWFFRAVPGFDGIRVPARFGMIVALALAALAGDAVARIPLSARRRAAAVVAALVVLESWAAPIGINLADTNLNRPGLVAPDAPVATPPPIYAAVASTPAASVLIELPLGEPAFDARAMFFSIVHRRRLVNGYSGAVPVEYGLLTNRVDDLFRSPDVAWSAVRATGATHLLIHEAGYANGRGPRVSDWAAGHGARPIATAGADRLFALP